MAAVIALVAVGRVGVSAAVVAVVGASLPCVGARRAGRGIFAAEIYAQPWSSGAPYFAMAQKKRASDFRLRKGSCDLITTERKDMKQR